MLQNPFSRPIGLIGASFLAALLITTTYSVMFGAGFVSDDFGLLSLAQLPIGELWLRPDQMFIRPLVYFSWRMVYLFWEFQYHPQLIFNLIFHLIIGVAVFCICHRFLLLSPARCLFAICLFAIFPLHSEAVSWLSGRFDVMFTTFYLLGIIAYIETDKNIWLQTITTSTCFLAALMCKEMAITFPVILFLMDVQRNRIDCSSFTKFVLQLRVVGVLGIIALGYLMIRVNVLGDLGGYGIHNDFSAESLMLLVAPIISMLHPVNLAFLGDNQLLILSIQLILAVVTGVLLWAAFKKGILWALGWYLVVTVVSLPLVNIGYFSSALQESRFYYLPSVVFCICVAQLWPRNTAWWRYLALTYLIVLVFLQWQHNRAWLQAGLLAQNIVEQIKHLPSGDKLLESIPDNIYGAYVFRNGLDFALMYRGIEDHVCWKTDLNAGDPARGQCGEEFQKFRWNGTTFDQL